MSQSISVHRSNHVNQLDLLSARKHGYIQGTKEDMTWLILHTLDAFPNQYLEEKNRHRCSALNTRKTKIQSSIRR
jgi:hypothetical protein